MIFVVDDEFLIRDTLRLILEHESYPVRSFQNGTAALAAAIACFPHLLLTDIDMPEMDGLELASRICEHCPDCRIVLMSGHCGRRSPAKHLPEAWPFLAKPFPPSALLNLVGQLYKRNGSDLRFGAHGMSTPTTLT